MLLCASAAHCARILQAAAQTRVNLHGLQPCTQWPQEAPPPATLVLWALLPATASASERLLEAQWRSVLLDSTHGFTIHMLYGSATQQAQQLAPWVVTRPLTASPHLQPDCRECLDASSEQKLFQHLLARHQKNS